MLSRRRAEVDRWRKSAFSVLFITVVGDRQIEKPSFRRRVADDEIDRIA